MKRNDQHEHEYVEERLSAYLDGELLPQERGTVERHLAACQSCRWCLCTLRQTVLWTRELPTIPLPCAFTIPAPARPAPAARRRWTFVPLLQGATAVVALLLVFVVAGDVLFTGLRPASAPQPAVMEQAPAVVQETLVVEAVKQVEVTVEVEKMVEAVAEEAIVEMTEAPVPAEPPPSEPRVLMQEVGATATLAADTAEAYGEGTVESEAKVAAEASPPVLEMGPPGVYTPTLQWYLTPTMGLGAAPEVTAVITIAVTVEVSPTADIRTPGAAGPRAAATAAPTAAAAVTLAAPAPGSVVPPASPTAEPMPAAAATLAPQPTREAVVTAVVEVEAVATPVPSPELPTAVVPTTLARAEEPTQVVLAEREGALQVPAVAWLRAAEAVLATTLVLLGLTTIVIMLLRRKP